MWLSSWRKWLSKKFKKKIQSKYDIIIYDIEQKNKGVDKTKVLTSPAPPQKKEKEKKGKKLNKYKKKNQQKNPLIAGSV